MSPLFLIAVPAIITHAEPHDASIRSLRGWRRD